MTGDELMLSSIPGVAAKATSTGKVVGVALEDFIATRAYSDTYINQFGDDLVKPIFTPINRDFDPRINDGCYFGGGNASGEEACVPLIATSTDGQAEEAGALAEAAAEAAALAALANVQSERVTLSDGREVRVGQVVMFVKLGNRDIDETGKLMIAALLANASTSDDSIGEETIWQRLVSLANSFIDGVLSVLTLKVEILEVNNDLCVDGVCVTAEDLRQMLEKNNRLNSPTIPEEETPPVTTPPEETPEVPTPEEVPEEIIPEEEEIGEDDSVNTEPETTPEEGEPLPVVVPPVTLPAPPASEPEAVLPTNITSTSSLN
jgi:hypothetical protein